MDKNDLILTEEGKKTYEEELAHLVDVVRPQVTQEIKEAKEQGDLSENADYDAARDKQAEVEARIKYLQNLLNHATIISSNSNTRFANLGSKVTLLMMDENEEETYLIVGPAEANPMEGKISNACALAQAIIGHKVNDVVTVKVEKPYNVKILNIA